MSFDKREVRVSGGVTYWSLGQAYDRRTLVEGFQRLGLQEFTPEVRGSKSALNEAVREYYETPAAYTLQSNEKILLRPIDTSTESKDTHGLAVVLETRETDGKNDYQVLRNFRTVDNDHVVCDPEDYDTQQSVNQLFRKHRQTVGQHAVARALVESLVFFGGTSLRPSGAVYWVEEGKLQQWAELTDLIKQATLIGESKVYLLRTLLDDSAVQAVKDAIIHEVRATAAGIEEKATTGNIGERAFRARRRDAQGLHSRVAYYENILGQALTELHAVADQCENAVVEAGLAEFADLFPTLNP